MTTWKPTQRRARDAAETAEVSAWMTDLMAAIEAETEPEPEPKPVRPERVRPLRARRTTRATTR
ncbi:MAG TPA: hypothetical protein VNY84_08265 [Acidimicrobiales bacterium]|nr:hypothetical protein [Acidimicrobiales bacterium]